MNETAQKRACCENHATGRNLAAISKSDAANTAAIDHEVIGFCFDHLEVRDGANRRLHGRRIELAVGLGARAAHGRALSAVQNPKLNAAAVRDPTHEAVQRIDFPDKMTFSEPANRRIAGHCTNCSELMGDQSCLGAHTGRRGCGFTAGMAAANHHDVESVGHQNLGSGGCSEGTGKGQNH
jgi:hypothetical protein